jgi:hypothetical protein
MLGSTRTSVLAIQSSIGFLSVDTSASVRSSCSAVTTVSSPLPSLSGQDYISSYTHPLHGSGRIDFNKVSPDLSFGVGDLIPRDRSHFNFPIELGFTTLASPAYRSPSQAVPATPATRLW